MSASVLFPQTEVPPFEDVQKILVILFTVGFCRVRKSLMTLFPPQVGALLTN